MPFKKGLKLRAGGVTEPSPSQGFSNYHARGAASEQQQLDPDGCSHIKSPRYCGRIEKQSGGNPPIAVNLQRAHTQKLNAEALKVTEVVPQAPEPEEQGGA